jgi:hypothetical protein
MLIPASPAAASRIYVRRTSTRNSSKLRRPHNQYRLGNPLDSKINLGGRARHRRRETKQIAGHASAKPLIDPGASPPTRKHARRTQVLESRATAGQQESASGPVVGIMKVRATATPCP